MEQKVLKEFEKTFEKVFSKGDAMLHYLNGTLAQLGNDFAVIECGGVGFKVGISLSTVSRLAPMSGKKVLLYTYMAVSEDNISLHGFSDEDELNLFIRLIAISGIGPKAAMSILGTLSADGLRTAVAHGDAKTIAQSPGVGLKTAQKLIIELKDKIGAVGGAEMPVAATKQDNEKLLAVVDTLSVYGFARAKITETLKRVDTSLPLEQLIAQTLRILGEEANR